MAHKKKHTPPVPPGNQPKAGAPAVTGQDVEAAQPPTGGLPGHEQDPKRRLGNYEGAGEHAYQQPGGLNDANH